MSFDHGDRAKARRVQRIMKEATIGPMFTRPLSRPKSIKIHDPQLETLLNNRKFLRTKYRVSGQTPQKSKKELYQNRRGLLCTNPASKQPGMSNYLSILKQKWQAEEAAEGAKLELTMSRPGSAACNVSRKEFDFSQYIVSLPVPMDLSKSSTMWRMGATGKRASTPAKKAIEKVLDNAVMMCNCATLDCHCGRESMTSLTKEPCEADSSNIDDIMMKCRELRRNTVILKNMSIRYLSSAITEQKLGTKKLLSHIKPKPWE